jgi:kumamolisin
MASAGETPQGRVAIPGSERTHDPAHPRVADAPADKQIEVTVYVRAAAPLDWVDAEAQRPPGERRVLTREQLAAEHGASEQDFEAVRAFAAANDLQVADADAARRSVTLRGSVSAVAHAFGAEGVGVFEHPTEGQYRGRAGALTIPAALAGVITGVFGIDERPQARPHLRFHTAEAQGSSYTPIEVATAYGFPAELTGAGETVAVIELGGGYSEEDLGAYFKGLGRSTPAISAVGVDGGSNAPRVNEDADGEVMLDIEVLGAVAPAAKLVVYFANTSDKGFIDAVSSAVHDTTAKPSVISISWGGPEDSWTGQARQQMEQIFTEAAALGVSVTVAAGDSGSTDGVEDGKQHVDFPASAPHALACGGTSLQASGTRIASETVWNDGEGDGAGGGGVSIEFPLPSYQTHAGVPGNVDTGNVGRGVPDVCGDADPATGYRIRVDGQQQTIGGTSAVAPLWAGLIALINQGLGKPVGFLQPQLYAPASAPALHDITQGDNGAYRAGPGWDACTGLGSPDGAALLRVLGGAAGTSGASQTSDAGSAGEPEPATTGAGNAEAPPEARA